MKKFDIVSLPCHVDDESSNPDWNTNLESQRVAIGQGELVSGSSMDQFFTVNQEGTLTYLKYKQDKDPFAYGNPTTITVQKADFAADNIAAYEKMVRDSVDRRNQSVDENAAQSSYEFPASKDFISVDNIYRPNEDELPIGLGLVRGQEFRATFDPGQMVTVEG